MDFAFLQSRLVPRSVPAGSRCCSASVWAATTGRVAEISELFWTLRRRWKQRSVGQKWRKFCFSSCNRAKTKFKQLYLSNCSSKVSPNWMRGFSVSYLPVAAVVRMGLFGLWELQQSSGDDDVSHSGINVPNGTVVVTQRCVKGPVGQWSDNFNILLYVFVCLIT